MAKWKESSSTVRVSNSYESTSHAKWSNQPNYPRADQTNKTEKSKPKDSRRKLEECLHSVLSDFNGSIPKTREKTNRVMKLIEKYCRFRSTPKSASTSSNATKPVSSAKSASAGKSVTVTKPSKSPSKPKQATKLLASSKSLNVTTSSKAAGPINKPKLPKISKLATTNDSLAVAKAKPRSNSPAKGKGKRGVKQAFDVQKELQRLADSDGFVTSYPSRYKRVPQPVDRFSVSLYDENRARRSTRRSLSIVSRCQSADSRQSKQINMADETPKKKKKKQVEKEMVFNVEQQKTVSETTSTIG